jgi:NIPSNAP
MIVVRDVFQIEPEKMKQAKDEIKSHRQLTAPLGYRVSRVMTDLTGDFYTLVFESEFASLAEYEKALKSILADKGWQQSYGRLRKVIRSGRREMYTVVD